MRLRRYAWYSTPWPVAALALCFATVGLAQDSSLGTFHDWSALKYSIDGKTVCSVWSQPTREQGKYKRRGDVFAFFSHTPGEKRFHELTFEIGYQFKQGSKLKVRIDGESYEFTADGSQAWNSDHSLDKRIARALRAGKTMVVKGTSSRNTNTSDSYSLKGFTKAHSKINRACNVIF